VLVVKTRLRRTSQAAAEFALEREFCPMRADRALIDIPFKEKVRERERRTDCREHYANESRSQHTNPH